MHAVSFVPLLMLAALPSCTGSPDTLALRPSFAVPTPAGPASVSIRGAPPDMTMAEFAQAVTRGMVAAIPATRPVPPATPYPSRRIVWHASPMAWHGQSQLIVSAFDGPTPFAYEEQTIDTSASADVMAGVVRMMTQRLIRDLGRQASQS